MRGRRRECVALVEELGAPVEFIVLPTFAYEHKVFVAPFSRKFPSARVFTAPACAPSHPGLRLRPCVAVHRHEPRRNASLGAACAAA